MGEQAPVVLFTYKRVEPVIRVVKALQNNVLADRSDLFIFSDGPKKTSDIPLVQNVRSHLRTISSFKSVTVYESETNNGLAKSIIEGVSKIFEMYDKVIVLEDDLLTSPNFLLYMNKCLDFYKNNETIFSISGYSPPTISKQNCIYDVFFFQRNSSHGWATWKNRWSQVNWAMPDYDDFKNNFKKSREFNKGGSDLSSMLRRQMEGRINSWSIRFSYHQFKTQTYTVYPLISKIQNIGFDIDATHTNSYNRFYTKLDDGLQLNFTLPNEIVLNKEQMNSFKRFYSVRERGMGKLKTFLFKIGLLKNK